MNNDNKIVSFISLFAIGQFPRAIKSYTSAINNIKQVRKIHLSSHPCTVPKPVSFIRGNRHISRNNISFRRIIHAKIWFFTNILNLQLLFNTLNIIMWEIFFKVFHLIKIKIIYHSLHWKIILFLVLSNIRIQVMSTIYIHIK